MNLIRILILTVKKTVMRQPENSEHWIFADIKALLLVGVMVVKKKNPFSFGVINENICRRNG